MTRTIDIHTHVLTEEMLQLLGREGPELRPELIHTGPDHAIMKIGGLVQDPYYRGGWDIDRRLADMASTGVDMQLLSPGVQTFFYDRDPKLAQACARLQNEQIAALCRKHPDRFMGLGAVPLQTPQAAADELGHAVHKIGLRGAQIGSHVNGRNLDDPALDPFWAKAEALEAFILIHPHGGAGLDRLQSYYLKNFIGLPLETTIAAASLVFGGVLERFPGLRIVLCHAGGFVPYQAGRFQHGWQVRGETKTRMRGTPAESLALLYYDTITHATAPLEFLLQSVGYRHIMLGSDYPFDMADMDCVASVKATSLGEAELASVLGGTAAGLLSAVKTAEQVPA